MFCTLKRLACFILGKDNIYRYFTGSLWERAALPVGNWLMVNACPLHVKLQYLSNCECVQSFKKNVIW